MSVHGQQYWQARFAADRERLEQRRQMGLNQATAATHALRQTWPSIRAVHLFGSILHAGFRDHSDLDLLVEGLPPDGLLNAIALAEAAGPLAVDLKRQEDLSDDLVDLLLRRSQTL